MTTKQNAPPQTSLTLTPLHTGDLDTVQTLQTRAFKPEFLEPLSLFAAIHTLYPQGCFIIRQDDVPIGYLFTHPDYSDGHKFETKRIALNGNEDALYIHDLCLDPSWHGRGIAQEICRRMEIFAQNQGFACMIGVAIDGVQAFWEKQGYTMLRPYAYHGQPALFMRKDLSGHQAPQQEDPVR